jgi:hypothetical protein
MSNYDELKKIIKEEAWKYHDMSIDIFIDILSEKLAERLVVEGWEPTR